MKKAGVFVILLVFISAARSQQIYDFGFERLTNISVTDSLSVPLSKAWDGGLNFCHTGVVDLNNDNVKDLVIFDKCGDRIICMLNSGVAGSISYTRAVEYEKYFPKISGWMQLLDYNCDGREDIFAYTPAGIMVYKNISDSVPDFELVTPMLLSDMGSSYSNITVTYDDYPAISDIDNDGDLDILVFFGLGAFVEMHQNLSMELTGTCDTLLYERTEHCWGNFAESPVNNQLSLQVTCPWKCSGDQPHAAKHTGSTMLARDMDNDGDADLLLGDVDYANLILLENGGTSDSANITSYDTLFPSPAQAVYMVSFPLASMADINNDGRDELMVSPFASNFTSASGNRSFWLYLNSGSDSLPVFSHFKNNLFQDEMIESGTGSYPVFHDYNNDGLKDLFVGNYGELDSAWFESGYLKTSFTSTVSLYENTGSTGQASFHLVTRDYAGLSQLGLRALTPSFADIDGDGDTDMIAGESGGKIVYLKNTAGSGNTPVYDTPQMNFGGIDAGDFSAPQFYDLNSDGLTDIVCGNKNGMLIWYKNTGTSTAPSFVLENDSLGGVNVTDYSVSYTGHSIPCFFTDSLGSIHLFCGSESGKIFHYKNIQANLYGKFTATDSIIVYKQSDATVMPVKDGIRSGVAVADMDNDLLPDMVYGNLSGGLLWYRGKDPDPYNSGREDKKIQPESLLVYPNPAGQRVTLVIPENCNGAALNIRIYNTLGIEVFSSSEKANTDRIMIDISRLPEGFYRCAIQGDVADCGAFLLSGGLVISR